MREEDKIRRSGTMREGTETRKRLKDMTPEEAREAAKERVAKGTAAATGSVEGYVDYTDPKALGEAGRKAAKTVRKTTEAIREERQKGLPGEPMIQRSSGSKEKDKGEFASGKEHASQLLGGAKESMKGSVQEKTREAKDKTRMQLRTLKQQSQANIRETRRYMRTHSPQEIRKEMRNRVGRRFAALSGGAEGFAENTEPRLAEDAVHKTAEAFREAAGAIREESQRIREGATARTGEPLGPDVEREAVGEPNVPVGDERYGERPTTYDRADLRTSEELEETRRRRETR